LELELEALDIADDPLELDGPDEAENEAELAKKLLDEQGKDEGILYPPTSHQAAHTTQRYAHPAFHFDKDNKRAAII
jgi:hypothetical protein